MEYHLFIIWEKALFAYSRIYSDIIKHLDIIQTIECEWDSDAVVSNFSRFYGANLPPKSCKEKECGGGAFKIIIVKDNQPQYEYRKTSKGNKKVNINIFDLKEKYRKWTNGGSKIHGTNNTKEFQHDLTLLLGLNPDDYLKQYGHLKERNIHQNIIGYNGWSSLKQLFYILSNTIDYVVLRGFNIIEERNSHDSNNDDIDILTTEYENAVHIINGIPSCSVIRPHQQIQISSKIYYLDLWDFSKEYYDLRWENDMLKTKKNNNGIFVLNSENDFFCLLYHCLINKNKIAPKYISKINNYYKDSQQRPYSSWEETLVQFLASKDYDIPQTKDRSIGYNIGNEIIYKYANRNGQLIQSHYIPEYNLYSRIYKNKNIFDKQGSKQILENEHAHLKKLQQFSFFPKILDYSSNSLKLASIPGKTLQRLCESTFSLTLHQQQSFLLGILDILEILYSKKIIHRDFTPNNIILDTTNNECRVYLIDFGWAIQYGEEKSAITPNELGEIYRNPEYFSDAYSFAQILRIFFPRNTYLQNAVKYFEEIALKQRPEPNDAFKIRQILSKKIPLPNQAKIYLLDNLKKFRFFTIQTWHKIIYPLHFRQWLTSLRNIIKANI